jgi:hypothetical protein
MALDDKKLVYNKMSEKEVKNMVAREQNFKFMET